MAEERKRWIEPRVSLGNILVLVTIVSGLAAGWARLESALSYHNERIVELEDGAKALMNERMREARDVADMRADMRWIRDSLARLERDLNKKD